MITLSHTGATVGIKIQLGRALLPVVLWKHERRAPEAGSGKWKWNVEVE